MRTAVAPECVLACSRVKVPVLLWFSVTQQFRPSSNEPSETRLPESGAHVLGQSVGHDLLFSLGSQRPSPQPATGQAPQSPGQEAQVSPESHRLLPQEA